MRAHSYRFAAFSLMIFPLFTFAQTAPDAGRILQELAPKLLPPAPPRDFDISVPAHQAVKPGGATMLLKKITFSGNSTIDEITLQSHLTNAIGNRYDLAGLKALANQVTAIYAGHNYPFARALIPAQDLSKGNLQILVVEGRYGQVQATGEGVLVDSAQAFLSALKPGSIINGQTLERSLLILADQPGIQVAPVIRPGQTAGTGDLQVNVSRTRQVGGSVSLDNFGDRYTGRLRGRSELHIDSPFILGDQITLSAIYSEEHLWSGGASYSLPLGTQGLRGNVGYAHTFYQLGKEFANLDANGTADIGTAGITYPLIRSQQINVTLLATYQHKRLNDRQDSIQTSDSKHSNSLPLGLNFDSRDSFGGGGITYGSLNWTYGKLHLDDSLRAADSVTANTEGVYQKANLDIARLQALSAQVVLFARLSSQLAADNLDSSEGFGLGGINGVRAYPSGEGYGDQGWLAQVELRREYSLSGGARLSPYAFYDSGRVKVNHSSWIEGDNHRSIAGSGFGLRASYGNFSADATAAWRTSGGKPQSDSRDESPMLWASINFTF
mgnify:CR=1 FL=1